MIDFRCSNTVPRCISPAKNEQTCQREPRFSFRCLPSLCQVFTIQFLCWFNTTIRSFFLILHPHTDCGKRGRTRMEMWTEGWKWKRGREWERKRDSLLIRTRHSLGTVVADHRRHRRQRVLTRGCWQAQAHAKALGCRIRSWRPMTEAEWPRYTIDG